MSEPIWCDIKIRVPDGWIDEIKVRTDGMLINGYTDEDVSATGIRDIHFSGEGNYGLWDECVESFLNWLETCKVPYVASSDPKYEFEGEVRIFTGTKSFTGTCFSEQAALTAAEWKSITAGTSEFDSVDEYFMTMNTNEPAFNFDLQDWPPPDPDEALTVDECEAAGVDGTLRQIGAS